MSAIQNPFIRLDELAQLVHLAPQTIRQYRAGLCSSQLLRALPEPAFTRPRLMWLRADVEAWLTSLSKRPVPPVIPARDGQPAKRRPGRPRKVQQGGAA